MRYLITGGAGFIGSHLADHLVDEGHEVRVIDNLSTGNLANIEHLIGHERFEHIIGNVLDYHTLERIIQQCDQIFHLAAAVGVKLIMEEPVETIITNVQGTENVLKLANYHKKKVLLASTSEVYGKLMESDSSVTALREDGDWRLGPTYKRRWAYACSKAMDEFLALAYHDEYALPVITARFFNTVGPRQTGRYGMVIPTFVKQALSGEPIQVYGDGEQTRCFTHVSDAVHAIVGLMRTDAAVGEVFNVGGGVEISMNELAEKIRKAASSSSEIRHFSYEAVFGSGYEDMRRRTPDITKINNVIGFSPELNIDDIVTAVIEYHRKSIAVPA